MPKRKRSERKIPHTPDFVKGLLISADEIPKALSGELEPRKVLAQKHTKIDKFTSVEIHELGMYQGRVVLVALAAELALKFVWETENGGEVAKTTHNLHTLFGKLSPSSESNLI